MSRKDTQSESRSARISFPIIEPKEELSLLGDERMYPDSAEAVARADEHRMLTEIKSSVDRVSRLLLGGAELRQVLDAMEQALGNPVAVVGAGGRAWRSAGAGEAETALAAEAAASLAGRDDLGADGGSFAAIGAKERAYMWRMPGDPDRPYAVVLFERYRPILPVDALSLGRMSAFVGLELANIEAVREVEDKYLELFLQDWLSGKLVSERDWKLRAAACGCELSMTRPRYAVVASFGESGPDAGRLAELSRALLAARPKLGGELLAVQHERSLVLIVPDAEDADGESADAARTAALRGLLGKLRPLLGQPQMRLFAGRPAAEAERLPDSLSQAQRAQRVAEVSGMSDGVVTYDKLGVYALLYLIPGGEERERFLHRYMVPLERADRKGGGRLTETLEMFFRCNGNIKLTSEKLYAHYNTIVYRLDKVQSILGVSLDDPEDRLQLQLSIKLRQLLADRR
ncbi:PucR family transcriptional regulator [Cohnella sp. 56]|uniref:PucR family transcriptional regulator n=1 Tax=Cohnella sp. 56 TaxID=3113722 RepID=UPI0030EAD0A8